MFNRFLNKRCSCSFVFDEIIWIISPRLHLLFFAPTYVQDKWLQPAYFYDSIWISSKDETTFKWLNSLKSPRIAELLYRELQFCFILFNSKFLAKLGFIWTPGKRTYLRAKNNNNKNKKKIRENAQNTTTNQTKKKCILVIFVALKWTRSVCFTRV